MLGAMKSIQLLLWLPLTLLIACEGPEPESLAPTPEGDGARIIYAPLQRPDADIPFPNNAATRLDPTSPTGRRLNLTLESPLESESKLRRHLNELDGFSLVGPITVAFEEPLDLSTVTHESVMLYDVSPSSPNYLEAIPLDLGEGAWPVDIKPRNIFPYEANAELNTLIFPADNTVNGEFVWHWEVATNTLILRTRLPLRPGTTYAVVLTHAIQDADGRSIRSPFDFVHDLKQAPDLMPLATAVPGGREAIAFAWSFTTRTISTPLVNAQRGLSGEGPLRWIHEEFRSQFHRFADLTVEHDGDGSIEALPEDPRDHRYILQPGFIPHAIGALGSVIGGGLDTLAVEDIDHLVFGSLSSVDLRDSEGVFRGGDLNARQIATDGDVPFMIMVPKETEEHQQPFPVVVYNHGARTSRLEPILVANDFARAGFAVMSIDAVGHGPFGGDIRALLEREAQEFPPELVTALASLIAQGFIGPDYSPGAKDLDQILADVESIGVWWELFVEGRSEDLDGDGVLLGGDGYFVPDPFQLIGNGLQTITDAMGVVRVLRELDPANVPPETLSDPATAEEDSLMAHMFAGDFDGNGVLDIGGPEVPIHAAGTSLGGIHTSVLMAVEPELKTGVPIVSGGGMTDLLLRTTLADAVDAILADSLGPAIVGCPVEAEDGTPEISLSWNGWAQKCKNPVSVKFAETATGLNRVPALNTGTVELLNERLLEEGGALYAGDAHHTSLIHEDGGFSVTVAANEGDPLVLILRDSDGVEQTRMHVESRHSGLARMRNTSRFRRVIAVAQTAMDGADPLAWARHLIREPLPGIEPRNILHLAAIGDTTVPFSSMAAWDRAAGLYGLEDEDAFAVLDAQIAMGAFNPKTPWDIDGFLQDEDAIGPLAPIQTSSGLSAVRHAATGDHEFIALADEDAEFDFAQYFRNQIVQFLRTGGGEIVDDPCLVDSSCDFLP